MAARKSTDLPDCVLQVRINPGMIQSKRNHCGWSGQGHTLPRNVVDLYETVQHQSVVPTVDS